MTCRWVWAVQVITLLKDPKAELSDLVGSEFEKVGKTVWYVATGWQPSRCTVACVAETLDHEPCAEAEQQVSVDVQPAACLTLRCDWWTGTRR